MMEAGGSFRQGASKDLIAEVPLKPRCKPAIGKPGKDRARSYPMFKGSGTTCWDLLRDGKK